jgi:hypothetical protein
MKTIYVASPLRARGKRTQQDNEKYAEALCRDVLAQGHAPFAPHLLYTRMLDDSKVEERKRGMDAGLSWLEIVDEVWVATAFGISEGMRAEVAFAKSIGKTVLYVVGPLWSEP